MKQTIWRLIHESSTWNFQPKFIWHKKQYDTNTNMTQIYMTQTDWLLIFENTFFSETLTRDICWTYPKTLKMNISNDFVDKLQVSFENISIEYFTAASIKQPSLNIDFERRIRSNQNQTIETNCYFLKLNDFGCDLYHWFNLKIFYGNSDCMQNYKSLSHSEERHRWTHRHEIWICHKIRRTLNPSRSWLNS